MARSFSYSGAGTVYTTYFGSSRGFIKIESVSFDESTGKITITWDLGFKYDYSSGGGLIAAAAAAFGGTLYDSEKNSNNGGIYYGDYMVHPKGTITSQQGSYLKNAGEWGGTLTYLDNRTHVIDATTSLTYGVRAQMNYGWGWENRWTSLGKYENINGGTLYFTLPQYDITYAANGGSSTPSGQTLDYNGSITLASGISRSNSTADGYTVTYNSNGGNTPSSTSQTQKNTVKYTFAGWKSSKNSTTYDAGASYAVNGTATMTAQWSTSTTKGTLTSPTCSKNNTTSTRTITYNANGGTCATSSATSSATVTYALAGWYTATSGGTKRVNGNTSYTPSATETLYAQWTPTTGSYSSVTLPTASRAGYIFKGWSTDKNATTGLTGSYTPTGNVTLYAIWQAAPQGNIYLKQNGSWVLVSSKYLWANR